MERRSPAKARPAATALLEQAEDFYRASVAGVKAAKPVLLYYCFMNLVKAYLLATHVRHEVNNAQHGLTERIDPPPKNAELLNAFLLAHQTPPLGPLAAGSKINLFDEFLRANAGTGLSGNTFRYDLPVLMPQMVPGHRLWKDGSGPTEAERFVSLERIELTRDSTAKQIWLRIYLFADDLKRINISHTAFLQRTKLSALFSEVACSETLRSRKLICFEQTQGHSYTHRPSDSVPRLIETVKPLLWCTVLSIPPYRKYYAYAAPLAEQAQVLPQTVSVYAMAYYLGSITRYRPHHFDLIVAGHFGPFIEAFLNDEPMQFLYLIASELAQRDVTHAAIA